MLAIHPISNCNHCAVRAHTGLAFGVKLSKVTVPTFGKRTISMIRNASESLAQTIAAELGMAFQSWWSGNRHCFAVPWIDSKSVPCDRRGRVIIGIDRFDDTKGLIERLHTFEILLDLHPEWRGVVRFVQVTWPTQLDLLEIVVLKGLISLYRSIWVKDWSLLDMFCISLRLRFQAG